MSRFVQQTVSDVLSAGICITKGSIQTEMRTEVPDKKCWLYDQHLLLPRKKYSLSFGIWPMIEYSIWKIWLLIKVHSGLLASKQILVH